MDLYIYYRVSADHAAILHKQIATLQAQVAAQWHVQTDIKRRLEPQDNRQTWMEIYKQVPDGFLLALHEAVARAGIDRLIDGPRHVEHFIDIDTCA